MTFPSHIPGYADLGLTPGDPVARFDVTYERVGSGGFRTVQRHVLSVGVWEHPSGLALQLVEADNERWWEIRAPKDSAFGPGRLPWSWRVEGGETDALIALAFLVGRRDLVYPTEGTP